MSPSHVILVSTGLAFMILPLLIEVKSVAVCLFFGGTAVAIGLHNAFVVWQRRVLDDSEKN